MWAAASEHPMKKTLGTQTAQRLFKCKYQRFSANILCSQNIVNKTTVSEFITPSTMLTQFTLTKINDVLPPDISFDASHEAYSDQAVDEGHSSNSSDNDGG